MNVVIIITSYGDFQAYSREKKNKTYISKPETGCQGRGIWITKNPRDIKPGEHMLLQVYMTKVSLSPYCVCANFICFVSCEDNY